MTHRLEFTAAAKLDVAEAAEWYANQGPGLEERFLTALEEHLDRIRRNPEMHSYAHPDLRRAMMRPFPYNIFYEVTADQISVVAVLHGRRNPEKWQGRLGEM